MDRFIVLLRHGIAEPGEGKPDEARELTSEGHRRMKQIGRGLRRFFPKAEVIVASPLVRAQQTAEWVAKTFKGKVEVTTSTALSPGSAPESLRELIDATHAARIIVVGHEPTLTRAMLHLTNMQGSMELKKGGCYRVRIAQSGEATLDWMLPPRVLRAAK
jgi:phosphohistidine phosphatase